ncbi:MAG: DAK2 domain-containing protein [Clostridia bacterium]|nr:DAK2 domain-containing protein [Clostridia bacterium]
MDKILNEKYSETVLDAALYAEMIRGGAACLRANAEEVNELNVFPVPDGDTGDNMSMTAEGGAAALANVDGMLLGEAAKTAARGMLLGARGNSGVILSQMFAGIAQVFEDCESADIPLICEALKAGVKKAYSAVMNPAEGTILTVMREGTEAACIAANADSTVGSLISDIVSEMKKSLERTPELLPVLKEAGVVDSGGAGVYYVFEGFLRVLRGEEIARTSTAKAMSAPDLSAFGPDSEMTYGYCTELMLQLQNSKVDPESFDETVITDYLNTLGNSIVAFKTGTIVKLHVHTMTPEKVLGFCRQFGEFLTVKIENMSVQHSETTVQKEKNEPKPEKREKYAIVAVASGEGMSEIFRGLGVSYVIDGGQTNNPSTSDFLEAFDAVNAENVFVFPNNGNIIMAANQASGLYDKSKVYVIPSRDVGAGYAALSSLDMSADDPEVIAVNLEAALGDVTTGYVSSSIRDAELNGVSIKNGDYIGFVGKTMLVSTRDLNETSARLAEHMMSDGDKFMLTVFCGKDASEESKEKLESFVSEKFPDAEVYLADGGQDVYPFIFVAE